MGRLASKIALILVTLWVGCLWAIGYIAAPTLFAAMPDKMLAGQLAGRMFTLVAWVGMGSGVFLLLYTLTLWGGRAFRKLSFWIVLLMWLLTVAQYFGIQPLMESLKAQAWPSAVMESAFKDRFVHWHGVSSVVYLLQSLLGLALVIRRD